MCTLTNGHKFLGWILIIQNYWISQKAAKVLNFCLIGKTLIIFRCLLALNQPIRLLHVFKCCSSTEWKLQTKFNLKWIWVEKLAEHPWMVSTHICGFWTPLGFLYSKLSQIALFSYPLPLCRFCWIVNMLTYICCSVYLLCSEIKHSMYMYKQN